MGPGGSNPAINPAIEKTRSQTHTVEPGASLAYKVGACLLDAARSPQRPVVCFDESPMQLIGEVRAPIPAQPGQLERFDCEYRRESTSNLFVFLDAHRPWRHVKVTERRTAQDFAHCMRELSDAHYPHAERIRVVLDNLSTHSAAALYETFSPSEARRVLRRLEFHYTPKHASWLNMVEIEIGVLRAQCLDRRIPDPQTLKSEIAACSSSATPPAPASSGCSMPSAPARKWGGSIPHLRPLCRSQREPVRTTVQRY